MIQRLAIQTGTDLIDREMKRALNLDFCLKASLCFPVNVFKACPIYITSNNCQWRS